MPFSEAIKVAEENWRDRCGSHGSPHPTALRNSNVGCGERSEPHHRKAINVAEENWRDRCGSHGSPHPTALRNSDVGCGGRSEPHHTALRNSNVGCGERSEPHHRKAIKVAEENWCDRCGSHGSPHPTALFLS
jgi:hypothetical protein